MHIHILGICGTFMGGLAALAREAGHTVTHLDDDADLVLGLTATVLGDGAVVAALHAAPALLDEPGVHGLALGHGEVGHEGGALVHGLEGDVALLGHQ